MNRCILTTAALLATWGFTGAKADASHCPFTPLVNDWYGRYLGRPADPIGLNEHVRAMRRGAEPIFVEASILGSDEYFLRHGGTPPAFIDAMFNDVVGRCARPGEMQFWLNQLGGIGCRHQLALRFLRDVRGGAVVVHHAPVIHRPAPVVLRPAPVVVRPAPVVIHHRPPVHRGHVRPVVVERPVVVQPRPSFSINLRFGR